MTTILPPKEGLPQTNAELKVYLQELIHMIEELQTTMPFTLLENIITKISDISNPYIDMEIQESDDSVRDNNDNRIDEEINNLCEEVDPFSGFKGRIEEWKEMLQEIEVALPENGYHYDNEYENIKRIKASVGSHSDSHYNIEINILNGMVTWSEGIYWESEYVIQADTESISIFIEGMRRCGILKWEQEYNNNNVIDGTRWNLEIEINNICIKKSGSNAFPREWEWFCKVIQKVAGKPFS